MTRNLKSAAFAVMCLGLAAVPAYAAKGGGGGASTTTSSSIAIASVNGTTMAAATKSPTVKLGDSLKFATTVGPTAGYEYPMVDLQCFQDVNGDGVVDTNLLGPDVVFTALDTPGATFTLGGYSSIWTLRGGGPATCVAYLDAYGWKSGKESVRVLADTGTWDAAG
ncbi:MAG TPA: hypothetical protein VFU10_03390 [Gaiellaceae bacterium]|nr:hypothetical protein [Gaiellaceae bacterium]